MPNFFRLSQSGQSMITAMLLGFGMAGVSGLVLWESQQAEKNLRIPRIRSAMSGVEAKVRMAATKPQTYNCTTDSTTTVGANCTLTIVNTDFQENFTGAKCSGSGACGIAVEAFTFVPATATTPAKVQTKISYQGQELSIKPIDVDIEVPLDLMQKSSVNCITLTAGAQPIFMGYRPDGSVICQALPGGCGAGEFVAAIDPTTLKLTCGKFPNSGSCGANEFMTRFDPMSATPTCTTRADAFTKFGGNTTFSSTRGQVSNPGRPGADSCVLITTTLPPTTSPPTTSGPPTTGGPPTTAGPTTTIAASKCTDAVDTVYWSYEGLQCSGYWNGSVGMETVASTALGTSGEAYVKCGATTSWLPSIQTSSCYANLTTTTTLPVATGTGICNGTASWTDSVTGGSCTSSYSENIGGVTCSPIDISNGGAKVRSFTVNSANGGSARVTCTSDCPFANSGSTTANNWVEQSVTNLNCPGATTTTRAACKCPDGTNKTAVHEGGATCMKVQIKPSCNAANEFGLVTTGNAGCLTDWIFKCP